MLLQLFAHGAQGPPAFLLRLRSLIERKPGCVDAPSGQLEGAGVKLAFGFNQGEGDARLNFAFAGVAEGPDCFGDLPGHSGEAKPEILDSLAVGGGVLRCQELFRWNGNGMHQGKHAAEVTIQNRSKFGPRLFLFGPRYLNGPQAVSSDGYAELLIVEEGDELGGRREIFKQSRRGLGGTNESRLGQPARLPDAIRAAGMRIEWFCSLQAQCIINAG